MTEPKPLAGIGRPSDYTPEIAEAVCERLEAGQSLAEVARAEGMPGRSTVYQWLEKHPEFADRYARARARQADTFADDIIAIADEKDEDANSRRIRIDARKWLAGKQRPKVYGDKVTQEVSGPDGGPVQIEGIDVVLVRPPA